MRTGETESWRDMILRTVREQGVCPWDELHVAANGDEAELAEAEAAADQLVREGLLVDDRSEHALRAPLA